jgi:hypothetical protein
MIAVALSVALNKYNHGSVAVVACRQLPAIPPDR